MKLGISFDIAVNVDISHYTSGNGLCLFGIRHLVVVHVCVRQTDRQRERENEKERKSTCRSVHFVAFVPVLCAMTINWIQSNLIQFTRKFRNGHNWIWECDSEWFKLYSPIPIFFHHKLLFLEFFINLHFRWWRQRERKSEALVHKS